MQPTSTSRSTSITGITEEELQNDTLNIEISGVRNEIDLEDVSKEMRPSVKEIRDRVVNLQHHAYGPS